MIGYEYGNTRVRVRASDLFDRAAYQGLLSVTSLDGFLGLLSRGPYGPDVERALGRYTGLRRLDETIRSHLANQLSDVLSFYAGRIRDGLKLYESRWDVRNVRAILRDLARATVSEPTTAFLVAAGSLDAAALGEIAAQRDVRAAVDLLSSWRLPSPAAIKHLRRALPSYIQTGDIAVLEHALDRAFGERVAEAAGEIDGTLLDLLQTHIDQLNLVIALRWRKAVGASARESFLPIPGGSVAQSTWEELVQLISRDDVAHHLGRVVPAAWRPAVSEWAANDDLGSLEAALERSAARAAASRLRTGDPLGIEIPLGFIGLKEAEAKNLRLIGRTIDHGLPRAQVTALLLGVA